MRIIAPIVEIMRTGLEKEFVTPEQFIERVGRTCYKSEDKITPDSAAKFVTNLIKRGHEAMIEHYNLIFKVVPDWYDDIRSDWMELLHNGNIPAEDRLRPFLRFTDQEYDGETRCIISGNMRGWRDFVKACRDGFGFIPQYLWSLIRDYPTFFSEYKDHVPGVFCTDILIPIHEYDLVDGIELDIHMNVTVKFICDRGVSHEIVRHRTSSFAQESTRYCNYGQDKFGNEITVIRPSWCKEGDDIYESWRNGCLQSEAAYFTLLSEDATPQMARSVLTNSLKTEVIMTTNLQGWYHFLGLRDAKDAHPDMQEVAHMTRQLFSHDFGDKVPKYKINATYIPVEMI